MKEPEVTSRFVDITDQHGIQTRHLEMMGLTKHALLIADYSWYAENEAEVDAWCKRSIPDAWRNGMLMMFNTEQEKVMFLLRWAK